MIGLIIKKKQKITRIDLALDDFDGEFSSAEQANTADGQNKFSLNNRKPKVQHLATGNVMRVMAEPYKLANVKTVKCTVDMRKANSLVTLITHGLEVK